ncbi:uncharacterized protein LOC122257252 [Penaeus japonicus]|uniref:uncharacterized protein LOC122257252 n=1 Tax=Penaeus japonicus TaxID=27405 RepID=UPI001C70D31E|nr:uncharacterized protein LOC122257252 [Penaeus japonicus]
MWRLFPMLLAMALCEATRAHATTKGGMGELSLRRLVSVEAQGVSPCITRPDGSAPNLTLKYESVFLKDGIEFVNMSSLHLEPDETGTWSLHCLAPVALSDLYFDGDLVLMVLARSEDSQVVALADERLSLKNVTVDLQQEGNESLRVAWNEEPGRNYLVQIWSKPVSEKRNAPLNQSESRRPLENPSEVREVLEVSGNVRCKNGLCVYYSLGRIDAGDYAAEVLDATERVFQSSRSRWNKVDLNWTGLAIESVAIETSFPGSQGLVKTLTATARWSEGRLAGEEGFKAGFKAVLINHLDRSDVLESEEGDCLPLSNDGCTVKDVQTLVDPTGGGQVTQLDLLLTQQEQSISSLVSVEDLHIRVENIGPGSVLVSWETSAVTSQFLVQVLPDKGIPPNPLTITCGSKASAPDCFSVFDDLFNGDYVAKVSFEGAVQTTLAVSFQVENGGVECQLPFEDLAGHCIMVDAVISGTWNEMKLFCHQLGGQLAKVDELEFMFHFVKYIRDNGIANHNYWIGGSDTATEGEFVWLDGAMVRQGTPYWSYFNDTQRPAFDSSRNCIAMSQAVFHYFVDSACSDSNAAVCEKVAEK